MSLIIDPDLGSVASLRWTFHTPSPRTVRLKWHLIFTISGSLGTWRIQARIEVLLKWADRSLSCFTWWPWQPL